MLIYMILALHSVKLDLYIANYICTKKYISTFYKKFNEFYLISFSNIWTALVAAPFRKLSATTHKFKPF